MGRGSGKSGRGSGRGGGRGGRGTGSATKEKTTLAEHRFKVGSVSRASDYVKTREFIINHIRKTYLFGDDIGNALDNSKEPDTDEWIPPVRKYNIKSEDPDADEEMKDMIKMIKKEQVHNYMKRVSAYSTNRGKAFAMIWGQCDTDMKNNLQARINFDTEIKGDPIKLLDTIKEEALNFQPHKYEMGILKDSMRAVLNMKQKEGESVADYTQRFKAARDVMLSHIGGQLILSRMVQEHDDYLGPDEANNGDIAEKVQDAYFAYCYMEGADQTRYGTLIGTMEHQFNLHNNQYPITMAEATHTLTAHKAEKQGGIKKEKRRPQSVVLKSPI